MLEGDKLGLYHCPDWYARLQAAKYLGVDPRSLEDSPSVWEHWALIALRAEGEAQEIREQRARGHDDR